MRTRMVVSFVTLLAACGPDSASPPIDEGGGTAGGSSDADGDGATGDEGPEVIMDQSGAQFGWVCDADAHDCDVLFIDGVSPTVPTCDEGGTLGVMYVWSRFVGVWSGCNRPSGPEIHPEWGRFVVCDADADCPQLDIHGENYECREGFCQNTDLQKWGGADGALPGWVDMHSICTGDEPRSNVLDPPGQITPVDAAVGAACPDGADIIAPPCNYVPDGCSYPR